MASVGLAVSALLLLGTVFIIASAQREEYPGLEPPWPGPADSVVPPWPPQPEEPGLPIPGKECASLDLKYISIPDICNEVRTVLHMKKGTGEVLRMAVIPTGSGCEVDAFLLLCNN